MANEQSESMTKVSRVFLTPSFRFRILTNQRTEYFRQNKLVTSEFISDMVSTYEKLSKSQARTFLLTSVYLTILYIAYSGSGVDIKLLGIEFSDVPKLKEISILLFSFGLFAIGMQILQQEILRQSIDSMIGSLLPNDEISQNLIKYRTAPMSNFYFLFAKSFRNIDETIKPVGITRVFNFTAISISLLACFAIYFIPITFLLFFAVPSMQAGLLNIGIGAISWACSLFLLIAFMSVMVRMPYDETTLETPSKTNDI